jgi:hypothetical protein
MYMSPPPTFFTFWESYMQSICKYAIDKNIHTKLKQEMCASQNTPVYITYQMV